MFNELFFFFFFFYSTFLLFSFLLSLTNGILDVFICYIPIGWCVFVRFNQNIYIQHLKSKTKTSRWFKIPVLCLGGANSIKGWHTPIFKRVPVFQYWEIHIPSKYILIVYNNSTILTKYWLYLPIQYAAQAIHFILYEFRT